MKIFNSNLIKNSLFNFKQKKWYYILLFLSVVVLFSSFSSIFKNHYFNKQITHELHQESGKYDYKIRIPEHRYFEKLQTNLNRKTASTNFSSNSFDIKTKLDQIKRLPYWKNRPFDFFWSSSINYVNHFIPNKNKRFFMVRTAFEDTRFNYHNKINRVVLNAGKLPKTNAYEVVINSKFAQANSLKIGDQIEIFNKKFTIVGLGNNAANTYLNFKELIRIKRQLFNVDVKVKTINAYRLAGLVFINRSLFNILVDNGSITDFQNIVYIKFHYQFNAADLEHFQQDLGKLLNLKPEGAISFQLDPSAGLRTSYNKIEAIVFSVVFLVGIIFIFIFIYLIVASTISSSNNSLNRLIALGFAPFIINLNLFFYPIVFFASIAFLAYFAGFGLDYHLNLLFDRSTFLVTNFQPFMVGWFFLFAVGIPIILSMMFLLFGFVKIQNSSNFLFSVHYKNKIFQQKTFLVRQITKIFRIFFIPLKIFTFIFFRAPLKKIFVFLLLLTLFALSFLLLFLRVSTKNYLQNQLNFYQPTVQNLTSYNKSTFLNSQGKIESNLLWNTFESLKAKITPIKKTDDFFLFKKPGCLLELKAINSDAVFTDTNCFKDVYIDIKNLDDPKIQKYTNILNFDKIFFNRAVYDEKDELPILLTNGVNKNHQLKSYFLPRNWKKFFNFGEFAEQDPNLEIAADGFIGYTNQKIPYALVSSVFKKMKNPLTNKNYKIGDKIRFFISLLGKKSFKPINVQIGAFIDKRKTADKLIFLDYSALSDEFSVNEPIIVDVNNESQKSNSNQPHFLPYNMLITKNETPNYLRYLTIDLKLSSKVFDIQKQEFNFAGLWIVNTTSQSIGEIINLSQDYFGLFETYFTIILVLTIIFVSFQLLLSISFLIVDEDVLISRFSLIGYQLKYLFMNYLILFLVLLLFGLIIGFGVAISIFELFDIYFQNYGAYLYIYDVWLYLLWILIPVIVITFFYSFYHYRFFQQTLYLNQ